MCLSQVTVSHPSLPSSLTASFRLSPLPGQPWAWQVTCLGSSSSSGMETRRMGEAVGPWLVHMVDRGGMRVGLTAAPPSPEAGSWPLMEVRPLLLQPPPRGPQHDDDEEQQGAAAAGLGGLEVEPAAPLVLHYDQERAGWWTGPDAKLTFKGQPQVPHTTYHLPTCPRKAGRQAGRV